MKDTAGMLITIVMIVGLIILGAVAIHHKVTEGLPQYRTINGVICERTWLDESYKYVCDRTKFIGE